MGFRWRRVSFDLPCILSPFIIDLESTTLASCRSPVPKRLRLEEGDGSPEEQEPEEPCPAAADPPERSSPTDEVEKMVTEGPLQYPAREKEGAEATAQTTDVGAERAPSPSGAGAGANGNQAPQSAPGRVGEATL